MSSIVAEQRATKRFGRSESVLVYKGPDSARKMENPGDEGQSGGVLSKSLAGRGLK